MFSTQTQLSSEVDAVLEPILRLAKKYEVARLELFGSAATDALGDESDVDFLVEFKTLPVLEYATAYFGLKRSLEEVLNRQVDLVELSNIENPYFLTAIEPERVLLYAA